MARKTKMFTPERVSLLFLAIALVALAIYYALYEYGERGNDVSTVVTETLDDSGSAKSAPANRTDQEEADDSTLRNTDRNNTTENKSKKENKSDKKNSKVNRSKKKDAQKNHRDHLNEPVPDI